MKNKFTPRNDFMDRGLFFTGETVKTKIRKLIEKILICGWKTLFFKELTQ